VLQYLRRAPPAWRYAESVWFVKPLSSVLSLDATDLVLIAAAQTIISPRQGELVNAILTN